LRLLTTTGGQAYRHPRPRARPRAAGARAV